MCKKCYNKSGHSCKFELEINELEKLLKEYSYEKIGKMFGVCGNSVKKRAKKMGIAVKYEPGYWQKKQGKLIKEEKEKNVKYCKDCNCKLSYKNKSGYCKKCIAKYNFKQVKI